MQWTSLARDIGEGTRAQPARIGLAFISLTLGMTALVSLLAILGGVRQQVRAMTSEWGVQVFGILQLRSGSGQDPAAALTRRHVEALTAGLPGATVTGLQWYNGGPAGLDAGTRIAAIDETCFRVRPWRLVAGRALDAADLRDRSRCAVASTTLARTLGLKVGDSVRLHNIPFEVVGIADIGSGALETSGDPALAPGDRLLLVPWSVPAYWLPEGAPPDSRLDAIFVKSADGARLDDTVRRAANLLDQPDYVVPGVTWVTPRSLVRRLMRFQRLIMLAGGAVVLLCLVLGGITLTSLLLAGVQNRIPEIGLRRALGASPAEVGLLFMFEALLVTLASTLAGMGLAWVLIGIVRPWSPLPLYWGPLALFLPLFSGLILGVLSSYWPARAAARIAPAEALRND